MIFLIVWKLRNCVEAQIFLTVHSFKCSEKVQKLNFFFDTSESWEVKRKLRYYFWLFIRPKAQSLFLLIFHFFHSKAERLCESSDRFFSHLKAQKKFEISAIFQIFHFFHSKDKRLYERSAIIFEFWFWFFIRLKAHRKSEILDIIFDFWFVQKLRFCAKATNRSGPKAQPFVLFFDFHSSESSEIIQKLSYIC